MTPVTAPELLGPETLVDPYNHTIVIARPLGSEDLT